MNEHDELAIGLPRFIDIERPADDGDTEPVYKSLHLLDADELHEAIEYRMAKVVSMADEANRLTAYCNEKFGTSIPAPFPGIGTEA